MANTYRATQLATEIGMRAAEGFPDLVTFSRATPTKGSAGGNVNPSSTNNTPANVPCRYRPASGSEVELAGKPVAGSAYMIFIPAYFSAALVDVDAKSKAVIAARSGGEPARTLNIHWIGRVEGIVIHLLAALEE